MQRIVVWDPSGKYIEGDILEGNSAQTVAARQAATLPVDKNLVERCAVAGYVRVGYGHGWQYDPQHSRRGAPVALYVAPELPVLNWIARLEPIDEDKPVRARLRFAVDPAQMGCIAGGISVDGSVNLDLESGHAMDHHGGMTIGGRVTYATNYAGLAGFNLYGSLSNARVMWHAITQTPS